uniref:Uncharacterized protein n=1 Tax=viral metagenome TaxID=1070528 RepID=A0A6C0E2P7_9ZZZZ
MNNKISIIQHGVDGFGHQLHGLFSVLILHNVRDYYFDSHAYCNKSFEFQHITTEESNIMKKYLIESIQQFKKCYNQIPFRYKCTVHAHELHNIPDTCCPDTLYSIDNAYYFDQLDLSYKEQQLHKKNIEHYKHFFSNKYLINRLNQNNIVIHVRLGDAMETERKDSIHSYNSKLKILMEKITTKFPDHTIYVHSDGNPDFLNDYNYVFFGKNTPLINVLSDLVYSKILICGNSSLSLVAAFLGNHEVVIVNDDNTNSMPSNTKKISEYIGELSQANYKHMKIALAFWGISRSLKYTIGSIQDKIINVLKSNQITYHVFMHTYKINKHKDNILSEEINIEYDNNDYKLLNPHFIEIEDEDEVKEKLRFDEYKHMYDAWNSNYRNVDNFIWALHSKRKVCQLVINSEIDYDYIMILRPDMKYITEFDLAWLSKISNDVICVPDFHVFWNINDRFFLMNSSNLSLFGNLFYALLNYSKTNPAHSESFYYHHLVNLCNLKIDYIPFHFNRVRVNGIESNDLESYQKQTF